MTSGLRNGADTYITLYNPNISVNATNDNYNNINYSFSTPLNDGVTLSSFIDFIAGKPGHIILR
jgi:hypothetical protein